MLASHSGLAAPETALAAIIMPAEINADTGGDCELAARAAEREAGLPIGLLQAIGRAETGRWDPLQRSFNGQPFSVNAGQHGRQFSTRTEAAIYVEGQLALGRDRVDIGCFQIDLHYHPGAFADWRQGFDPATNAAAASRILRGLYARSGDWNRAIGLYHSADPARGGSYLHAVLRAWAAGLGSDTATGAPAERLDPFTVLVSMQASRVAVWTPIEVRAQPVRFEAKLPAVITP